MITIMASPSSLGLVGLPSANFLASWKNNVAIYKELELDRQSEINIHFVGMDTAQKEWEYVFTEKFPSKLNVIGYLEIFRGDNQHHVTVGVEDDDLRFFQSQMVNLVSSNFQLTIGISLGRRHNRAHSLAWPFELPPRIAVIFPEQAK